MSDEENKVVEDCEDPELEDLLQSTLTDFETKTENKAGDAEAWDEDKFIQEATQHFQQSMRAMLATGAGATDAATAEAEFSKVFENIFQGGPIPGAAAAAAGAEGGGAGDDPMAEMMRLMGSMSAGGDTASSDGDTANPASFMPIMSGLLMQVLSKDILYPSFTGILQRFPAYMEENRGKLKAEDVKRFEEQQRLMRLVCDEFDGESNFDKIFSLMQEMQVHGFPPKEVVDGAEAPPDLSALGLDPNSPPGDCVRCTLELSMKCDVRVRWINVVKNCEILGRRYYRREMAGTILKNYCRSVGRLLNTETFCANHRLKIGRAASTYKAAICNEYGKPLVIQDVVRTKLLDSDVRVKVHAAAVNVKDVACIAGKGYRYHYTGKAPFIPGFEVCGEVLEVGGSVKKFRIGDRVICLNHSTLGGFAQECVAEVSDCWGIDQNVAFDKGAALLESYATAILAFGHRHRLKGDGKEVVLVTAAAGGLGLAAVDVVANVFKAKVIAVCATEEKNAEVRDIGAWASLTFDPEHVLAKVREVTGGKGVDIVYEAVGGPVFETALKWGKHEESIKVVSVKHEGTLIVVAFSSGKVPRLGAHQLFEKAPGMTGLSLPHYRESNPALFKALCDEALELFTAGLVSPKISYEMPLESVNDAFAVFTDAQKTGKVLVVPDLESKK
ncbi:unnamed protein product [Notodromas monacha]|uniref:Peroxin-19 n=1 Tax=Notodromas monacha TaxID=399045 RepID=A0A7R9BN39_9CRUS|nr:unnamed protein product [Notodromas monacha]CAG0918537.1 unnamed protein product [Notodromas monacha]